MKKFMSLFLFVLLINTLSNAQYRIYKTKYDFRTYKYQLGDPYNPTFTGIASLWIPGLGQIIAGETGRGLAFFFAEATPFLVYYFAGYTEKVHTKGFEVVGNDILPFYIIGIAIWSCIDGVRVAKVNNLAWRDKNKSSLKLEIQPFLSTIKFTSNEKITAGISLRLTFKNLSVL